MSFEYIGVHILDVPYTADCEYTYLVPSELREEIELGSCVVVPFGRADRHSTAIVSSLSPLLKSSSKAKEVISVLSKYFSLSKSMLELCFFMKKQTLCTIGDAVKCIIPSAIVTKTTECVSICEGIRVLPAQSEIYDYIKAHPQIDIKKLKEKFPSSESVIKALLKSGAILKSTFVLEKDKAKYETRVKLKLSREESSLVANGEGKIKLRSQMHKDILALLCERGEITDKEIYRELEANKSHLDALLKKDLITLTKEELVRDPYILQKENKNEEPLVLNELQSEALEKLKELYSSGEPRGALLYGVTGSGKTSVIKKMIDEVINSNRGVIILVPEISLTPQTVSVFCGYYGKRVAVIHSSLSKGERFDTYKRIYEGEADIVIGTRSAVFAPVKNLGMIVIDEEQEHTYKSDTSPKYLAHDIARFRVAKENALMLLASATPSLTSYYKAMEGSYTLIKMMSRYGSASLPNVIITDMRRERARGNLSPFSTKLIEYLGDGLENGKQSILFLNRRGYHSSVACQDCGKTLYCPNCSVALTYHSYRKIEDELNAENTDEVMGKSGVLRCHYCGYLTRLPSKCPECHADNFNYVGYGTQKVEGELEKLFSGTKSLRLDADTTGEKSSYERILGAFKNREAEVLIGTQMVTKGHNFPLVTLVGVMMADTMLYTNDYRSSERTFSMLTQVIGRAGRAKDKGVAIIQTNSPNDQAIVLASRQDYDSFYENEIQIRRAYDFPPFCDLALISLSSQSEELLNKTGTALIKELERELTALGLPAYAYGPFDAPIYKAQGRFRKRIIIKCKLNTALREMFSKIYTEFLKRSDKVNISFDFNPSSM